MKSSMKRIGITMMAVVMALTSIVFLGTRETEDAKAASKPRVQEVEYDREDKEVNFDFYGRVKYRKLKVKIYSASGKNMARYIIDRDSDDIEVKVKKLKYGKKYRYKISGIKKRGASKYTTIKGTFKAIDR